MPPKLVSDDGKQRRDPPAGLRGRDRPRALGRAPRSSRSSRARCAAARTTCSACRSSRCCATGSASTRAASTTCSRDGQRRAVAPDGPEPLPVHHAPSHRRGRRRRATRPSTTMTAASRRLPRRAAPIGCSPPSRRPRRRLRTKECLTMKSAFARCRCCRRRWLLGGCAGLQQRQQRGLELTATGRPTASPAPMPSSACRRSRRSAEQTDSSSKTRARGALEKAGFTPAADGARARRAGAGRRARQPHRPCSPGTTRCGGAAASATGAAARGVSPRWGLSAMRLRHRRATSARWPC